MPLRITSEIRQDLEIWLEFLKYFKGIVFIPDRVWLTNDALEWYTDSAGSYELGAACYMQGQWAFHEWHKAWRGDDVLRDMTFLELVPVVLALILWGERIANKRIIMWIDNEALVYILNKQTAKSKRVMVLVRNFVLLAMRQTLFLKQSILQLGLTPFVTLFLVNSGTGFICWLQKPILHPRQFQSIFQG